MPQINIVVVDDHQLTRQSISALLKAHDDIAVVNSYASGEELLNGLGTQPVDVVLLDLNMPGLSGFETAKILLKQYPSVKVVIHTMSQEVFDLEQLLLIGVHGCVLKSAELDELAAAIKTAAQGSRYFGTSVIQGFIKGFTPEPLDGDAQV